MMDSHRERGEWNQKINNARRSRREKENHNFSSPAKIQTHNFTPAARRQQKNIWPQISKLSFDGSAAAEIRQVSNGVETNNSVFRKVCARHICLDKPRRLNALNVLRSEKNINSLWTIKDVFRVMKSLKLVANQRSS